MTDAFKVRELTELSDDEIAAMFDAECGIKYCTFCGAALMFTRDQMIEFLDGELMSIECTDPSCKRTYLWGDF